MKIPKCLCGLISFVTALCAPLGHPQDRSQTRSMVISRGGIVATESPLASQAGVHILEHGGILAHPRAREFDYSSLRRMLIVAAPVSPDKLKQAVELFGPCVCQFVRADGSSDVYDLARPRDAG